MQESQIIVREGPVQKLEMWIPSVGKQSRKAADVLYS
jgi:hypothetical protein